jgi:hypothetical protein
MDNICGLNSMLGYVSINIYVTILNNPDLGQKGTTINNFILSQVQWGTGKVLGNPDISIATIPIVKSIGDFNIDTVFTTQPEFAVYAAMNGATLEDELNAAQCQSLLANDTNSYKTLLNPDNMRMFYLYYSEGAYGNIMSRFGLTSYKQCDLMYGYLEQMVDDFIMFGSSDYTPTALGIVTAMALNDTFT